MLYFVRCCGCFMFVTGHWTLISLFMSDMSLWVAKCQVNMSASIEIWTSVTIYIYLAACNLTSQMNVSQFCLKKLYTFNRNYCVLVPSWGQWQCKEWSDDAVWGRSILLDFDVIHDNGLAEESHDHMTRVSQSPEEWCLVMPPHPYNNTRVPVIVWAPSIVSLKTIPSG